MALLRLNPSLRLTRSGMAASACGPAQTFTQQIGFLLKEVSTI
jgi:hypothetical protein